MPSVNATVPFEDLSGTDGAGQARGSGRGRFDLTPEVSLADGLQTRLERANAAGDGASWFGLLLDGPHITAPVGGQAAAGPGWWEVRPALPGLDGEPLSELIALSDGYVLAADEALYFREYSGQPYGWMQIWSNPASPTPTITSHGLIFSSEIGPWGSGAIGAFTNGPTSDFGHVTWRNTGRIYSDASREGNELVDSHTIGGYFAANTTFVNSGLLQSTSDWAGGFTGVTHLSVTNEATGVIRVWSDSYTAGFDHMALGGYLDGTLDNAGLIEVSSRGLDDAMGIWGATQLNNTGLIRVHAGALAIGLYECLNVVNSGRIEADVAVWAGDGGYSLVNTGEIIGDVYGHMEITNTGVIEGNLYFYDQQTIYDGRGGELWGSIYLGSGQNTVHLADNGGAIFGWTSGTNALNGGAGDDLFDLMGGANTIAGGGGFDTVSYLGNDSGVTASLASGSGRGGADAFSGIESLVGSAFNDVLTGAATASRLNGGAGGDTLQGGAGADRLVGGTGDDSLSSGGGADTLIGGFGSDTARFDGVRADYVVTSSNGVTTVRHGTLTTTLTGIESIAFSDQSISLSAAPTITGTAAGDSLTGGDGDDRLVGLNGDDVLAGGLGSDTIEGGDGIDTAVFYGMRSQYLVDLAAGTVENLENTARLTGIERVRFNDQTILLRENGGLYLAGLSLADTLVGTERDDEAEAGGGADVVEGLGGDDVLSGQDGNDVLSGGDGLDRLYGGLGDDVLSGGEGLDQLYGDIGDDALSGGSGDLLSGDDGADRLLVAGTRHESTAAVVDGGAGVDTLILRGPDAYMDLAAGEATAGATAVTFSGIENVQVEGGVDYYSSSLRTVFGNAGANQLSVGGFGDSGAFSANFDGREGDDVLIGGLGGDVLTGGVGRDVLDGRGGADILNGEAGDTVMGGDGDDRLIISASASTGATSLSGGAGADTVVLSGASISIDLASGVSQLQSSGLTFSGMETILVDVSGPGRQGLSGDAGANRMGVASGGSGAVHLQGRDGDDVLFGGAGSDMLDGGTGIDTASFENQLTSGLTIRLDLGTATAANGTVDTLVSIENARGTGYNDTIFGTAGTNEIWGGSGADVLLGLGGNDILHGGGFNANTMYGGQGDDLYIVEHEGDSLIEAAGEGIDTVETAQMFRLGANIENLTYTGLGNFRGEGNALDNVIRGGSQRDFLYGQAGDDTLIGGGGITNELYGGAGNDRYLLEVADAIFEEAGGGVDTIETATLTSYTLQAEVENLIFLGAAAFEGTGNAAANTLTGGSDADTLRGEAGDDRLQGGLGADWLDGGLGVDVAVFSGPRSAYLFSTVAGVTSISGPDGVDTLRNVERLRFDDGLFDLAGAPVLESTAGPDLLNGSGSGELLDGLAGDDVLNGLGGDDILRGGAGADTLNGGDGVDTADYATAAGGVTANLTTGSASNDGDGGSDSFSGIENLTGSGFADSLTGNGAANLLIGGVGADTLDGAGGDDNLRGGGGVDVLSGGAGFDTADYTLAAAGVTARLDSMRATNDGDGATDTFSSIEALTGSNFNDLLIGGGLGDTLRGGLGADTLLGQGGNDVLWGGSGAANTLQGGLGDDLYVLEAGDSIVEVAGQGVDTVDARIALYNLANNVENLIFGGVGNFTGAGNAGNNTITGGAGDDVLRGRGGVDVLQGGLGMDTADYSLATAAIHARLDNMRAVSDGDGGTDTFVGIEAIVGSAFNDLLVGGGLGDRLSGGFGADTLLGFAGNDVLAGGQGAANQLQGGLGDDLYVLDAYDTVVELAGQGIDTIEAHVGAHNMGANVENMYYVGNNKFYGTGNALSNVITGGVGDDILKGMGGDDILIGGAGTDQVQFRGSKAQYTVTAEGNGYRVVDSIGGRDGSTFVDSIEVLRFMTGNTTTILTYAAPAPLEPEAKAGGDTAQVLPSLFDDDAFVLPALPDDESVVLPGVFAFKFDGEPLVLPGSAEPLPLLLPHGPRPLPTGDWMFADGHDGGLTLRSDDWM